MLHRLPRHLPSVEVLLLDMGNPAAIDLSKALNVSVRTIWRWQAGGWPRCAHLALFYASRWGWSSVDCDAYNAVTTYRGLAQAYRRELDDTRAQLDRVLRLGNFGAANLPVMSATAPSAARLPVRSLDRVSPGSGLLQGPMPQ